MRKTLYVFGALGLFVIVFLFFWFGTPYVSLKKVSVVKFSDNKNGNEFVRVAKDGKWGVTDKSGIIVLDMEYDYIDGFHDGLAVVKKNGLYGAIDETFNVVVEPKWKEMGKFNYGYAVVRAKNNKVGIIDKYGRITLKPLYYDQVNEVNGQLITRARNYKDKKDVIISVCGDVKKNFNAK